MKLAALSGLDQVFSAIQVSGNRSCGEDCARASYERVSRQMTVLCASGAFHGRTTECLQLPTGLHFGPALGRYLMGLNSRLWQFERPA